MAINAPAKPLRSQFQNEYLNTNSFIALQPNDVNSDRIQATQNEFVELRNPHKRIARSNMKDDNSIYANMSKHTLHALSATPKPRLTNDWVQYQRTEQSHSDLNNDNKVPCYQNTHANTNNNSKNLMQNFFMHPPNYHQNQKSGSQFNYHTHWLIQEAEQRRLDQQRGVRSSNRKSLPDSVIKTITQRVQSMGIGERRRFVYFSLFSLFSSNLIFINFLFNY